MATAGRCGLAAFASGGRRGFPGRAGLTGRRYRFGRRARRGFRRIFLARLAVVREPEALLAADAVILPGVGAFGAGMDGLRASGLLPALEELVRGRGRPLLGICLGMQLLASEGEEHGSHAGMGWIPGRVTRLAPAGGLRVPHIGWNDVAVAQPDGLFKDIQSGTDFYFVHSYAFRPDDGARSEEHTSELQSH